MSEKEEKNLEYVKEMMLAIEANIEFLKKEGNAQLIIKNGNFIRDIGESFLYEFTLDFFQDVEPDVEVEVRIKNDSVSGKIIALEDKKIQVSLDKNIGESVAEARLIISNYYLLELLHKKLKGVESGETKFTDLPEKLLGIKKSDTVRDTSYRIPHSLVTGIFPPNHYQEEAIRLALGSEISYIWGPPGTGKTDTIARIIEGFISKNLSVLLLSHTNKATDGALTYAAKLLENTEDYREGRFIRIGKGKSIDDNLKRNFPLVIQENILESRILPLKKELHSLEDEKLKINNLVDKDALIIKRFGEIESITKEIKIADQNIQIKREQLDASKAVLLELETSRNEIVKKIEFHQSEGFFVRMFLGSLESLVSEKARILIAIEKEERSLDANGKDFLNEGRKVEMLKSKKEIFFKDLGSENITESKERHEKNKKLVSGVDKQIRIITKKIEELSIDLIKEAKLIATTLVKSYSDKVVLEREYDAVIIDEASMAPLPAVWCAAGLAKKKVVIVGDFYQLPPVVKHRVLREGKSEEEAIKEEYLIKQWLVRDIFNASGVEAEIKEGKTPVWLRQLRTQYRMHPDIANVVNELVYSNAGENCTLENGENTYLNGASRVDKIPLEGFHIGLYDTSSIGTVPAKTDSGSYYNFYHAFLAVELAKKAIENGYETIGIVTPFRAQANLIQKIVSDSNLTEQVQADTVHRFQGDQKQIIIFDVTSPNKSLLLDDGSKGGDDEKVINVALSRAQEKCIILADVEKLLKKHSDSSLFKLFIQYCDKHNIKMFSSEGVLDKYYLSEEAEKWIEKVYDIETLTKETLESGIFDESNFYKFFIKDLLEAEKEVIIDSPYITKERMRTLMPVFEHLRMKDINVFVITRKPSEHNDVMREHAIEIIKELEKLGVVVLEFKGQIHRKIAIIDRSVTWSGSLNILSQRDSKEHMRRFKGEETAAQLMNFLRFDKNIGKLGENKLERCDQCKAPGAWFWTAKGMFGLWTFCLAGNHKKGSLPKTEKEIKKAKKTLTKVRKAKKQLTESGIPICQVHNIPMLKKEGRFGVFWGCEKYPRCRNTAKI